MIVVDRYYSYNVFLYNFYLKKFYNQNGTEKKTN